MVQITDWKESTNSKVKSIANSFVDSKFPRQQIGIETPYQKMNRRKPRQEGRQTTQINNNNNNLPLLLQQRRDAMQLLGEILETASHEYKGMLRMSSNILKSNIANYAQRIHIVQEAFNLGLLREVTDEEKIELAEHRLVQKSWGSPCYYGQRYSYKAHPSKSSINKYIRMRLKRVYILTEKGRKLGEILRTMKELLLLVN